MNKEILFILREIEERLYEHCLQAKKDKKEAAPRWKFVKCVTVELKYRP